MKKGKTKLLSLLLCFVLVLSLCALGLAACSDDNKPSNGPFDGVSGSTIKVELGRNASIRYTGNEKTVVWEIENENIASYSTSFGGKICAIKGEDIGTTKLHVTYGKSKKTFEVVVTERNTITVKSDGETVTGLEVESGKSKTLTASTNLGSKNFTWTSSNTDIVKVTNKGVVTGIFAGKATITVKVSNDEETYLDIPVTVTAPVGTTQYMLLMGAEGGTQAWVEEAQQYSGDAITADTFFMWHTRGNWGQTVTFDEGGITPRYNDGVISFKYKSNWNPGLWTGMQIFYKKSDQEVGHTYKLTCKINIKSASLINQDTLEDEPLDKVKVTLNEQVIELNKGMNDVEVYYVFNAPLGQGGTSSFDLQMGWADPSHTNGWFVQNADVEISDVDWVEDNPVDLKELSFTYEDNTVTIDDPNTEGVGSYLAYFYDDHYNIVGTSIVKNGEDFNGDPIDVGVYTVRIRALGVTKHYKDSPISEDTATYVDIKPAIYTMTKNGAIEEALSRPGTWAYFNQWYVSVKTARHEDGVTTLEFSNNDGEFDTLQLYYKNNNLQPLKNYQLTVDIELLGDDDGGYITLNGNEIYLLPEKHTYEVGYTEQANGASFAMLAAIFEQNESGTHQITSGTINVSNLKWTPIATPIPLTPAPKKPTVTVENGKATVKFDADVTGAYKGYEIGFFTSAEAANPDMTEIIKPSGVIVSVSKNEANKTVITRKVEKTVDLAYLASGTYVVKVRAKGDGLLYAGASAWSSESENSFTYENPNGDVYKPANNNDTPATSIAGKWTYWAAAWIHETAHPIDLIHINDQLKMSFENNAGDFWVIQLFMAPKDRPTSGSYKVKLTINVENALITGDGNIGGDTYNPADHEINASTFKITVDNKAYDIQLGEHEYTFTINNTGAFQICFGISGDETYNRISSANITISDPVIA